MERSVIEDRIGEKKLGISDSLSSATGPCHADDVGLNNLYLAKKTIQTAINQGVSHFFVCPGGRNAPLVTILEQNTDLKIFWGFEERATAFFALGKAQELKQPTAIIVTSGTAAGELLPAMMEAYYCETPVLAITADRPSYYRGSGAPQACEQGQIFGNYSTYTQDVVSAGSLNLALWQMKGPAHLNICFDEPLLPEVIPTLKIQLNKKSKRQRDYTSQERLEPFLNEKKRPLAIVNSLGELDPSAIKSLLLQLNIPAILENVSNLSEDPDLRELSIHPCAGTLASAYESNYPVDCIIRIGGVPTLRMWRDIENLKGQIPVLNISTCRFSGLSWGEKPMNGFMSVKNLFQFEPFTTWKKRSAVEELKVKNAMNKFPISEPSLVSDLAQKIPENAFIYLGNSQPIRLWDFRIDKRNRGFSYHASRGLNGIDGQIATFLGMCRTGRENWCIIGDLTALYDLNAPWFLSQIDATSINIVIINNGGGHIFKRMFQSESFLNKHTLNFKNFAAMWGLSYEKWIQIPQSIEENQRRIIEICPDPTQTNLFWDEITP